MMQLFHDEAGKHLYTAVITDNLPFFTFGLAPPTLPTPTGRISKLDLVRKVTALSIEYGDKQLGETFGYDVAFLHFRGDRDNEELRSLAMPLNLEVEGLRDSLGLLTEAWKDGQS